MANAIRQGLERYASVPSRHSNPAMKVHFMLFAFFLAAFFTAIWWWTNRQSILLRGSFHSVTHKGAGEALVVRTHSGDRLVRLRGFKTYPAPDLDVCLVSARDAEDTETVVNSGFVCLGPIAETQAYASFPVPAGLDLDRHRAVAIWSRRHRTNFTTAPLFPVAQEIK